MSRSLNAEIELEKRRIQRLIDKYEEEKFCFWKGYYSGLIFAQRKIGADCITDSDIAFVTMLIRFTEKFERLINTNSRIEKFKKLETNLDFSIKKYFQKYQL